MKVCMITSSYPRYAGDGAGSFVGSLARALAEAGHGVCVLAPYDPAIAIPERRLPNRPTLGEKRWSGGRRSTGDPAVRHFRYVPTRRMHIAGYGRALQADTRMRWLAPLLMPAYVLAAVAHALAWHRREQAAGLPFDLIHGHWAVPGGFIAALVGWLTRRPVLISLHGSDVYVIEHNPFYAAAARWAFRHAALTVACSRDLCARAVAVGLPKDRAAVIPYGVDAPRYGAVSAGDVARLRQRLGLPLDALVIGALGRMVHKKGFAHLLAALAEVLRAVPNARGVIGGAGDLLPDLRAQAERLGLGDRVLFPGAIDWQETPILYAACDVFAVPSVVDARGNVDGLPNVLLEAMASGRAIVASRVAGIPDVLRDGENGLLVPPGDEPALATALVRLLHDEALRDRLGVAARRTVVEGHTWQGVARQYEEAFRSALGAPVSEPVPSDRLHNPAHRAAKADKILAILHHALGPDLSALRTVDIGCASGLITQAVAPHVRWIVGLEYSAGELRQADELRRADELHRADATTQPNVLLVQGDGAHLPLPDASVDLALCAQVYEHVADADALASEVYRVLRPGGACFFSGPNRLDPIERHYGLPLLSWLPRPLADAYVRLARRGTAYRERPRTYWGLRRLWRSFEIVDYNVAALRQPQAFHVAGEVGRLAWVGRLPEWLLRALRPLYPNYNWLLRKARGEQE